MRYGNTPAPETPHHLPRQIWDDLVGAAREQARAWRLAFFATLLLCGAMAGGWYWQAARGTVIPWVVEVDKLGNVQSAGPAQINYHPTDPVIARDLSYIIQWLRAVSVDKVDMGANWRRAYEFLTDREKAAVNDFAQHNDPFAKVGKEQVAVEVTSVIRASDQSFRIEWIERHTVDGGLTTTEHWNAIATVVIQPPHKPNGETLNDNPLGIYIDALNWSKELD